LPSQPSRAERPDRGVGAVDRLQAPRPRGDDDAGKDEVPLIAGIDLVDGAHAELRDAEVGGVVAGPEDDRLDAIGGVGDRGQVLGAARALDLDLEPDARLHAELRLELRQQVVREGNVIGPLHLRQHDAVECVPGARDDVEDVAEAPCRVDPVDADGARGSRPLMAREGIHDVLAGRVVLLERRDGVLEVEEDHVGREQSRLRQHLGVGAGDGEAGSAQAHPRNLC
jgi:hypothetical protein